MPIKMEPISVIKADLGLNPTGDVHAYFTNTCYKHMDKYVPLDNGELRTNVTIETNSITYDSPYAHYQYIGELYVDPVTGSSWASKDSTKVPTGKSLIHHSPGTGPYWDERMWSAEGQDVIKETQDYFNRRK